MNTLEEKYCNLLEYQKFDESSIGEEILKTNIDQISNSTFLKGCALSVFDVYRKKHVYESEYYKESFNETHKEYFEVKVHPDDYEALYKNSVAIFKHLFSHNKNAKYNKVIREYRALVRGKYQRVIEQITILAFDKVGNIWLCLSIVDIAPDQAPPYIFNSKIVNFKTGLVFPPLDGFYNKDTVLSSKEVEILKLIGAGQLSNEISNRLHFSVNTINIHRQSIFKKFNVDTSIEAIRYAENLGLLDSPL